MKDIAIVIISVKMVKTWFSLARTIYDTPLKKMNVIGLSMSIVTAKKITCGKESRRTSVNV